ncbi:site-specific integrase [Listeria monocytogenes]|nr:site-specific integrase [Listeria monocytogenes]
MVKKVKDRRYEGSIEQRSKNSWRMRVTVGYDYKGTPIRADRTTRTKNEREREKELRNFITELEQNGYTAPARMTFKAFVENEYMPKHAQNNLEVKTWTEYYKSIVARAYPAFGGVQMDKITTLHIVNLVAKLQKPGARLDVKPTDSDEKKNKPLSPRSIRNIYFAINSVFETAVEWKVIPINPAEGVRLPKTTKRPPTIYTPAEIELLNAALVNEPLRLQVMIYIALISGCREAELAALEVKHVNLIEDELTFEQTLVAKAGEGLLLKESTKNDVAGIVSIPAWLTNLIETYISDEVLDLKTEGKWANHKFLFANMEGKPIRPDSIYQRWRRFLERHNLPVIRFHDLRHTSATLLLNKGRDIKIIQERLRHKSSVTTSNIYAHVLKDTHKDAASDFENPF